MIKFWKNYQQISMANFSNAICDYHSMDRLGYTEHSATTKISNFLNFKFSDSYKNRIFAG